MFELKWVRAYSGQPLKLYYRVMKFRIDASGAVNVLPAPVEWSEWKEVPEYLKRFDPTEKQ